jgi:hypothetical protein
VVGGVGLTGDDKDFAYADVFNGGEGDGLPLDLASNLDFVPTSGGDFDGGLEAGDAGIVRQCFPWAFRSRLHPDLEGFQRWSTFLLREEHAINDDGPELLRFALEDLIINGRAEREFWGRGNGRFLGVSGNSDDG